MGLEGKENEREREGGGNGGKGGGQETMPERKLKQFLKQTD